MPVRIDHKPPSPKDRAHRMTLRSSRHGSTIEEIASKVQTDLDKAKNLTDLKAVLAKYLPDAVLKQIP